MNETEKNTNKQELKRAPATQQKNTYFSLENFGLLLRSLEVVILDSWLKGRVHKLVQQHNHLLVRQPSVHGAPVCLRNVNRLELSGRNRPLLRTACTSLRPSHLFGYGRLVLQQFLAKKKMNNKLLQTSKTNINKQH